MNTSLRDFIERVITGAEGATSNNLSFAVKGTSGASYGRAQNDIGIANGNLGAQQTLRNILTGAGFSPEEVTAVMDIGGRSGITESQFRAETEAGGMGADLLDRANVALNSETGSAAVSGRDNIQFGNVTNDVQRVLDAAQNTFGGDYAGVFSPSYPDYDKAVGLLSAWDNRNNLNQFPDFVRSMAREGIAPELHDIEGRIQNFFQF